MQRKLPILYLFVLLFFVFSCDKSVTEPLPILVANPEPPPEKPLVSNISLSGLYYLYQMADSYYGNINPTNFLPYKDSLTIKFSNPSLIEISMRIGRNLSMFVDTCAIYTGIGKITSGSRIDKINFGDLTGKAYYVSYLSYNTNPNPVPIDNRINNFKINGDTLKLNLLYRYYRWWQGKPSGGVYNLNLTFIKVT